MCVRLETPSRPIIICGVCRTPIEDVLLARRTRCPHCDRNLRVPTHVRAQCPRCGRAVRVRTSERSVQRFCVGCGMALDIDDVVLTPRRRRRVHTHSHRPRHTLDRRADAAWAVMIIGLAILICLMSIIAM